MPNIEELYPPTDAKYFRAEEISMPLSLKISKVEVQKLKDDQKLVLHFENETKQMVVNATNARDLAAKFGKDYSTWTGKTIVIGSVPVNFAGKQVKGIRIVG